MGAASAILFVFIGCCSNVIFLELIVKDEPASGNIITFFQFLFIAIEGFVNVTNFGTKENVIPLKEYIIMVFMFFTVNVTNNMAFGFKISMPLHIIFRSGGLIASLIMGVLVLGRKYTTTKYSSVIMITLGTIICTLASAENLDEEDGDQGEGVSSFMTWLMGIAILTFALFMSARMGIFQEVLFTKHGKHPREALFYIHLMSLPGFILTSGSIIDHAQRFTRSDSLPFFVGIPVLSVLPKLWIYLIGNIVTQFLCVSSVFRLTSECSSLTVTLVLTLRKFMSLVFSIIYFQNPFTLYHWLGTILVFAGTLLFTGVIGPEASGSAKAPLADSTHDKDE